MTWEALEKWRTEEVEACLHDVRQRERASERNVGVLVKCQQANVERK